MTDDLTRELNDLIPELDASTVLDGAARKRRRTRRRTAVLASALAVAVFTPLVVGLGTVMRSTPQPASSTVPPLGPTEESPWEGVEYTVEDTELLHPGVELMTPECQAVMAASIQPDRVPTEGLPDGATRVWLCGELGVADGVKQWIGPRTPIVTHTADVVAAINALQVGVEAEQCYDKDNRRYRMVVEYADARHVIDAHIGHCDSVGGTRNGAKQLLEDLKGWFSAEREQGTSPPAPPPCPATGLGDQDSVYPLFPVFAPGIAQGVACGRFNDGAVVHVQELSPEILTALRDAQWELSAEDAPWIDKRGYLAVANEFGDTLLIFRTPAGDLWMQQHGLTWSPDPDTAARLKELFAGLGAGTVNSHPCHNVPYTLDVEDSDIVSVHICGEFPLPSGDLAGWGSYTLPDGLARQVTEAFAAQATSGAVEPPFLSHHLLLVDSKGTGLILFPGPDHTLVDPLNKRVWQVPDHLRLPLEGRGLIFP